MARSNALPSIVLFVDEDAASLDAMSHDFDRAGFWTATADNPAAGLLSAEELKPDLVVTDLMPRYDRGGVSLLHTLKHTSGLEEIPVILVTDRDAGALSHAARREADLVLVKPLDGELLLRRARATMERARTLRARGTAAIQFGQELRERSSELHERTQAVTAAACRLEASVRSCPKCRTALDWIERGSLGGSEYDYYHWCIRGCGLFCYDRTLRRWLRLAG